MSGEESYPYQVAYDGAGAPAQVQSRVPMHERMEILTARSEAAEKHIVKLESDMEEMARFVMSVRAELGI